jgi:hypothetical protein
MLQRNIFTAFWFGLAQKMCGFNKKQIKYMDIQIIGTIEYINIGTGSWAIVTDTDEQYEIWQPAPESILQDGLKIQVNAKIRDDVMSMAAIGDVVEIKDFRIL